MTSLLDAIREGDNHPKDLRFPHAPAGWTRAAALKLARQERLAPGEDHWETVRALQEYFSRHAETPAINTRELHDALDEKFHAKGGRKYLFQLFPGGPIAQGCRIAGLKPPAGTTDKGFGSVV
ncbi:MAG: TusE/DsrC/DsvC family sulfur relay protein [Pseudomonadota bacterium]